VGAFADRTAERIAVGGACILGYLLAERMFERSHRVRRP
jgi:hypothetical protein